MMGDKKQVDMTLQVLISIRDEIKALREDTNKQFEKMDKRFENIEADIGEMKGHMKLIVARFDRDYLLLATDMGGIKSRLHVCENRLGIEGVSP
jgi:hypothetical protein